MMPDNFRKPKNSERPAGFYITWTQIVVVCVVIVFLIGVLSFLTLSPQPSPVSEIPVHPNVYLTYGGTVDVDSAQGWQPTGLRLQAGQVFTVEYLQGDWSIFPDDGIRYTADGGAAVCGASDCVEPLPSYTTSGLIGRIGDSAPFPVGSYLETTAQQEGMLQLRVNDAGTYDNEGSIMVRVSLGQ